MGYSQQLKSNIEWINLNQLSFRYCITDNNGFVWLGTELGLYRFDGIHMQLIKIKEYPELSNERVKVMGKDFNNDIIYYATSPSNSLFSIQNNRVRKITKDKGVFLNSQKYLPFDNPLYKIVKKSFAKYLSSDSLYIKSRYSFINDNHFVITSSKKILKISDTKQTDTIQYEETDYMSVLQFDKNLIILDKKGAFGIKNNSLLKIKTDSVIDRLIRSKDLRRSANFELILNCDNNYYMCFNNKLYQFIYNNNFLSTKYLFDFPANDITSIAHFKDQDFFLVGTKSKGMAVIKINHLNNVEKDIIYAVASKNNKWYSYNGWIYDEAKQKLTSRKIKNYSGNARFLLDYKKNIYYESTNNKLTSLLHLKKYAPIQFNNDFKFLTSYSYLKSKLWIANETKVGCLEKDSIVAVSFLDKLFLNNRKLNAIKTFGEQLIFATTKGVFFFNPKMNEIKRVANLEKVNARYIKPIDNNSFWLGCYGDGLFLVKNNIAYKVIDKDIDLNTTHGIEEDKQGNLWISTNNGLLTINKKNIFYNTLKHQPISCYRFSTEDGLLTNEFNGGGTHTSLQTVDGIIGFPSMKGFVWFNPNQVKRHLFKGSILMDKVIINNKIEVIPINNQYSIPIDTELLTFNFSYGYYFNRENLSIAYRFQDQPNWTSIIGNSFQTGRYKKGKQKLLIRITTHGFDDKQGIIQSFKLNFEAHFYEETWFWLLIVLLFFSLLVVSYRIGLYFNKKRELVLQFRIKEKTAELSQNVTQLENSKLQISKSLQEKEILLKEIHHRVKNNLQLIISMLNIQARRKNYDNIEAFLQKANTRISSMALIHQRLYQSDEELVKINFQLYIEDLVNSIIQSFHNEEDNIIININTNQVLLNLITAVPLGLIINELVTNALKHAFPENKKGIISITIRNKKTNQFELIVEDNGIGFKNNTTQTKSFGLELINLLASQLNGMVKIENTGMTKFSITFQEIDL